MGRECVALGADVAEDGAGVEVGFEGFGELGVGVGEEADLNVMLTLVRLCLWEHEMECVEEEKEKEEEEEEESEPLSHRWGRGSCPMPS